MITQPTILNSNNFTELMRMRFFVNFAEHWMMENNNYRFSLEIEDIYYDMGSNWKYTALVTYRESDKTSWQSLDGREWVELVNDDSVESIKKRAYDYMERINKQF